MAEYAKVGEISPGDKILTDGDFTCMKSKVQKVRADRDGDLYINCGSGRHYLDAQLDDGEFYIGISKIAA